MSEALTIGSAPGPVARILPFGATVQRLEVTGGDGRRRNVVLSLPYEADYRRAAGYLGATIGRYANRIAHGRFVLDGRQRVVVAHARGHSLHAGPDGFDRHEWSVVERDRCSATLSTVSPDGDQGFPGQVSATARFEVVGEALTIRYRAVADAPTVVAMTHHGYVNLGDDPTVDDHLLCVDAEAYTPVDDDGIPLGRHAPVEGTAFDLRRPRALRGAPALDHNYVLNGTGVREVAWLECASSRTRLTVHTDQAGMQVFAAGTFDGTDPPGHGRGAGVALEPQAFPDSPRRVGDPEWTDVTLRPGETYESSIEWRFSTW